MRKKLIILSKYLNKQNLKKESSLLSNLIKLSQDKSEYTEDDFEAMSIQSLKDLPSVEVIRDRGHYWLDSERHETEKFSIEAVAMDDGSLVHIGKASRASDFIQEYHVRKEMIGKGEYFLPGSAPDPYDVLKGKSIKAVAFEGSSWDGTTNEPIPVREDYEGGLRYYNEGPNSALTLVPVGCNGFYVPGVEVKPEVPLVIYNDGVIPEHMTKPYSYIHNFSKMDGYNLVFVKKADVVNFPEGLSGCKVGARYQELKSGKTKVRDLPKPGSALFCEKFPDHPRCPKEKEEGLGSKELEIGVDSDEDLTMRSSESPFEFNDQWEIIDGKRVPVVIPRELKD